MYIYFMIWTNGAELKIKKAHASVGLTHAYVDTFIC